MPAVADTANAKALDGYVRVSRVGGRSGDTFISPDLQEERIRAYAAARGFEIGVVFRELDRSGNDRDRPHFQTVLARVAEHQSAGVIVARLDRFARSAIDALTALREIRSAGGMFVSVEDGFDSSTPFGQAMMTILLALAELELARVRDTWDMSQRKAIARGLHTASRLPVGYLRGQDKRLVPDESVAPIIAEAFRLRAEGATYGEIAQLFTDHGVFSSGGRSTWRAMTVEGVMKNRVYTGEARHGPHRNPTAHPAIVPMHLWVAAQFGAEVRVAHPSARTLLAGLIRCAGCCHVLGASWMPLSSGRPGRQLNGYRCRQHFKGGHCPEPAWVLARDIEPLVIDRFFARLKSRRRRAIDFAPLEAELAAVEADYGRLRSEQRLFSTAQKTRIAEAAEAVDAIHNRLLDLVRRDAFQKLPLYSELRKTWPQMDIDQQRRAIGHAFDAVMIERGEASQLQSRVYFIASGETPDYFPVLGAQSAIRPFVTNPNRLSADALAISDDGSY